MTKDGKQRNKNQIILASAAAVVIIIAIIITLVLLLGGKSIGVDNYSLQDEAYYYQSLTGEDTTLTLSISTTPFFERGAVTMPTTQVTEKSDWYIGSDNTVSMSLYKAISSSNDFDTMLVITFSGSSSDISSEINTNTAENYLSRYLSGSTLSKAADYIEDKVNKDLSTGGDGTGISDMSASYTDGDISGTFSNDGSTWSLVFTVNYNNYVVNESNTYIEEELLFEIEPELNTENLTSFIGDASLPFVCDSAIDMTYLRKAMQNASYDTVNESYQYDENISVIVDSDGNMSTEYYISAVFAPTTDSGSNVTVRSHCMTNSADNTITFEIEKLSDDITDERAAEFISFITEISIDSVDEAYAANGEEITIDEPDTETSTAYINDAGSFIITVQL